MVHHHQKDTVTVYTPHYQSVLEVAKSRITHVPPPNITRLVLCETADCALGDRCRFVHADVTGIPQHPVHVNYAWRSLEECEYERYEPGRMISVCEPNGKKDVIKIPSERLLKTRLFDSCATGAATSDPAVSSSKCADSNNSAAAEDSSLDESRLMTCCAHFHYNRTCNLGPKCHFAHVIHIDPTAKLHQRAPAPSAKKVAEEYSSHPHHCGGAATSQSDGRQGGCAAGHQSAASTSPFLATSATTGYSPKSTQDSTMTVTDPTKPLQPQTQTGHFVYPQPPSGGPTGAFHSAHQVAHPGLLPTLSAIPMSAPPAHHQNGLMHQSAPMIHIVPTMSPYTCPVPSAQLPANGPAPNCATSYMMVPVSVMPPTAAAAAAQPHHGVYPAAPPFCIFCMMPTAPALQQQHPPAVAVPTIYIK